MSLPNFLIIGAQKAGTSSLYQYLKQHPEIYLSPVKEAHFFSYLDQEIAFKDPMFYPGKFKYIDNLASYEALFSGVTKEKAIGEVSPSYIYIPQTASRIHRQNPGMKIIAILRNPAERAFSNFVHNCSLPGGGEEPLASFAEALAAEEERKQAGWSSSWHYKSKGYYYEQLKRYYDLFGAKQIQICKFEDLKTQPEQTIAEICTFLGVDSSFTPELGNTFNASGLPKNKLIKWIRPLLQKTAPILKSVLPQSAFQRLKGKLLSKPKMSDADRSQLMADYTEDIRSLEELTQQSFQHWLK